MKDFSKVNTKNKPMKIRKLSHEEVQERIHKKLHCKCDEKQEMEHHCKASRALMLVGPSDDENGNENIKDGLHNTAKHQLVELKENEEEAKQSLNDISGVSKLSTMQLKAQIRKHKVYLLVDSGSTYNFISVKITGSQN